MRKVSRGNSLFRSLIRKLLTRRIKTALSLSLVAIAFLSLLSQFLSFRPIQDDYFILGALTQQSVSSILRNVWEFQGGNLLPYAVNSLLLTSSLDSVNFVASKAFLMITVALVILVSLVFLRWFGINNRIFKLTYISISLLAFEGIFTPLQVAAYSWHQTSITHLWPIAVTILAWNYSGTRKIFGIVIAFAGFVVGNSNSAEALWSIISTSLFSRTFFLKDDEVCRLRKIQLKIFTFTSSFGLAMTMFAPGFWNRANNAVGMPDSISELFFRFSRSLAAFSFDFVTHPFLWLAFALGLLCRQEFGTLRHLQIHRVAKFLISISFLLYVLLIIGTTIGYPSWHQSLGLYLISVPTMFLGGLLFHKYTIRYRIRFMKILCSIILFICFIISLRTTVLVVNRANHWDVAYHYNVCMIRLGHFDRLVGAELIFPYFNKGIEDINRWDWMRKPYIVWISSSDSANNETCGE